MIRKLRLLVLSLSSAIMLAAPLAIAGTASAALNQTNDINNQLCSGSNGDVSGGTTGGCDTSANTSVNKLITDIIDVISVIVGIIAVIMIIVAGLRYITSGGKQESVTGAKNTILYAVIGLVIVALAQLIVHFVLNKTTSATT